jgi:hypothetical protein
MPLVCKTFVLAPMVLLQVVRLVPVTVQRTAPNAIQATTRMEMAAPSIFVIAKMVQGQTARAVHLMTPMLVPLAMLITI